MGALLVLGFVVMIVLAGFELYIVFSFPRFGHLIEEYIWFSLIFSVLLSIGIGLLYPTGGISAMMGGVGSTLICQPVYWTRKKIHRLKAWSSARKASFLRT